MSGTGFNPVGTVILMTAVGFIPFLVICMTGFLKISVVLFLVRNALGVQQTPPNLLLYAIALVLTVFVSAPLMSTVYSRLAAHPVDFNSIEDLSAAAKELKRPIQAHLLRFTKAEERKFFLSAAARTWPEEARADLKDDDLIVLMPAFIGSELTRAFEIGFLLYLPFVIIDLVVSNVLMAMGMMMVSPTLISVPLKLFLFVSVDGWSRLMHGLILSYS
ncbi:MAG: type III secretion system export apparatus subunit SctR [Alphaproteobacteria bacterium]|nr:type III secretion system export apparatus subunit SctR [Alphaproteobacteria bacterium]